MWIHFFFSTNIHDLSMPVSSHQSRQITRVSPSAPLDLSSDRSASVEFVSFHFCPLIPIICVIYKIAMKLAYLIVFYYTHVPNLLVLWLSKFNSAVKIIY